MNQRRPVYRKCVVTKEILLKGDLYRLVKTSNGVIFDKQQNIPGRGAYIKKDLKTIELAHKNRAFNKALRCEINDEIFIELIQSLSKEREER